MATTANTLTNIYDKILARAHMVLRETCVMPQLVNGDFSAEAARKGTTIDIPVTRPKSASAVTPAETPPAPEASTQDLVQIPLDQWYHQDFHLSDKDLAEIDKDRHFIPGEMGESVRAIANQVNTHILNQVVEIGNKVEASDATAPFTVASNAALVDIINMRKQLKKSLCPTGRGAPLRLVVGLDDEAKLLQLAPFRDASQSTKSDPIIEGTLGRFLGFDIVSEDAMPSFTPGTGDGYLVNNTAGLSVGATTIAADTGVGTIVVGDSVYFGTDTTKMYAVTSALSGGSFSIAAPGLRAAVADNATITVVSNDGAAFTEAVAFHRDCFAFATRALGDSMLDRNADIRTMQDPKTGLVLRLEVIREYKQWVWDLDMLWGAKVVRPEFGCRIGDAAA